MSNGFMIFLNVAGIIIASPFFLCGCSNFFGLDIDEGKLQALIGMTLVGCLIAYCIFNLIELLG